MHLLTAKPGGFSDEEGIIDLQQSPSDVVILSSQDTSLGILADVIETLPEDFPTVRLANLVNLFKPAAYDLYEHSVLQQAKLIVVSLLGGKNYWPYGIERLHSLCTKHNITLVIVPGDDHPDPELLKYSRCKGDHAHTVWRYLREGGKQNTRNLMRYLSTLVGFVENGKTSLQDITPPKALPDTLIYNAAVGTTILNKWLDTKEPQKPTVLLLFYRSHVQSGNTNALEQFISLLEQRFNVLPVATLSLKNNACLETINFLLDAVNCHVVINTTSFSQRVEGNATLSSSPQTPDQLFQKNIPVIQAIMAANSEEDWQEFDHGLRSRDIAMNIALPEYDGRIIGRAITFKNVERYAKATQIDVIRYQLHAERASFIASLAENWANLSRLQNKEKRITLVLSNYPTHEGRIGNGVGLDTPASTMTLLQQMQDAGYVTGELPQSSDALIKLLQTGVTNDTDKISLRQIRQSLSTDAYLDCFSKMPQENQDAIIARWGSLENDPLYTDSGFAVSGVQFGNTFVGIQPARGFNVDLLANYHDPDLVPPHGYLAFYFWLRHHYQTHAIVHVGKHGNLEWLPGKSVALSSTCWPDTIFGPLPHLYPFIVNDPGEGAQAKRRIQAVVLDHLMPPMARAEVYGEMLDLENLVDEYYQAIGLDNKRETLLREKILSTLNQSHILQELPVDANDNEEAILNGVDTYLCDLKEAQIRHGLHCYGEHPNVHKLPETLVALTRLPRGNDIHDQGLLSCLAIDLNLINDQQHFDPLKFEPGKPWAGAKPQLLNDVSDTPWRTEADTRERLEQLAEHCIERMLHGEANFPQLPDTNQLLIYINDVVAKAVTDSSHDEVENYLSGLNGQFIPAGPSGAPTRGRLDVLPTGRNFYSLDSRAIPTRSAWELGQRSAEQLIQRHLQENGEHPKQIGLSVWGTATMRTGGDDIAQALALMGVRPIWAQGSNRVTDIEVIPGFQLNRPRVDVTLRISGFFRDAFPNVARLFDCAVQTLADLDEPGDSNTLKQNIKQSADKLINQGMDKEQANTQSRFRIFGSKPGSYGAGLQGLIDEGIWDDPSDLAKAYVNWGGYSYSTENFGQAAFQSFENRLQQIDVVIQNQDNREHDVLDSDDYYQFQGGMSNAIKVLSGQQPTIYHGDHANPSNPKIRTLKEELNRVIRSRMINPKWISAMQEHGYKGAFEMAASVDYLFAYDATTDLVDNYQYEAVTDALVLDSTNRSFMQNANPNALKEMSERLLEAQQRGLWTDAGEYEEKLVQTILEIDNQLESPE